MHDERGAAGGVQGGAVDLVAAELGDAERGFILFAHADPHVGVKDVGPLAGGEDVGGDGGVPAGAAQEFGRRLEAGGRGDVQGEPAARGGPDP